MSSLKICHLTSAHERYDVRIFKKECVSLSKIGYDVSLVVADGYSDEVVEGVKIYGVEKGTSRLNRFIKASKNVYDKAVELNADIYHFHDPELLPYGNKLKSRGKIVIFDAHEDLPRQILSKHYLPKFTRKIVSFITEKYEAHSTKKYDAVISATKHITNKFSQINNCTETINNYPFISEFHSERGLNEMPSNRYICYVGGISKIRGLTQLVNAMEGLNVRLKLAGPVSESYLNELKSLKGWKNVDFYGKVSREKVKQIFEKSIAGVVTFLPEPNHVNAQPNKLFEYMSSGLPVIGANYPLWREILEGEKPSGICVDPENINEIKEAIIDLVENSEKTVQFGNNGIHKVMVKYNWEAEELKLDELYKSLVKKIK